MRTMDSPSSSSRDSDDEPSRGQARPFIVEDDEDSMDEDEELALERAALGLGPAPEGGAKRARPSAYNVDVLHERLEDISRIEGAPWLESLLCTSAETRDDALDAEAVEDDLARELFFYNQALSAAKEGIAKLERAGKAWRRPDDFLSDMVKSDEHMRRVKDKLLHEKKVSEDQEARRKQREAKKYAKQVQAEKLKERAQTKSRDVQAIKDWRKQREKGGYGDGGDEDAMMAGLEAAITGGGSRQQQQRAIGDRIGKGGPSKSRARQARDSKFGFGGRKKLQKQNDARSASDVSSFSRHTPGSFPRSLRKGSGARGGGSAGPARPHGVLKKKKGARPGKSKRAAMRGRG